MLNTKKKMKANKLNRNWGLDEDPPSFWKAAMTNSSSDFEAAKKRGDNINAVINDQDVTPAHVAAIYGHFNFLLLARQLSEFNPCVVDKSGRTPFDYSSERQDGEAMDLLDAAMTEIEGFTEITSDTPEFDPQP